MRRLGWRWAAESIIWRQPFPGPGLAVRCLGEVTGAAGALAAPTPSLSSELGRAELLREGTQQAFAVLLPVKSVGVMGDYRTYGKEAIALRAVTTRGFYDRRLARLPYEVLAEAGGAS